MSIAASSVQPEIGAQRVVMLPQYILRADQICQQPSRLIPLHSKIRSISHLRLSLCRWFRNNEKPSGGNWRFCLYGLQRISLTVSWQSILFLGVGSKICQRKSLYLSVEILYWTSSKVRFVGKYGNCQLRGNTYPSQLGKGSMIHNFTEAWLGFYTISPPRDQT